MWKKVKLLKMSNFTFSTMFSMQSVSLNLSIGTFQLLSAASLNLGWSQNGVLGNGFKQEYLMLDPTLRCGCLSLKTLNLNKGNNCNKNL